MATPGPRRPLRHPSEAPPTTPQRPLRGLPFRLSRTLSSLPHAVPVPSLPPLCAQLFEFIKGRRHSLDPRGNPNFKLELPLPEGARNFAELAWDVDVLRTLIIEMLNREHSTPADLLVRWGGAKGLGKRDWQARMRQSFFDFHDELWTDEVEAISDAAFELLLKLVPGQNFLARMTVVHLER